MPDADGLRQRAEQWLADRPVTSTELAVAEGLVRDLLATMDQGQRAYALWQQSMLHLVEDRDQKKHANRKLTEQLAAAEAQRQGLQTRIAALEKKHRGWKSECWNPINPHARTCQNGEKPCELCAAVMQAHADFADEVATLIQPGAASPKEE